jgi:hypothetical protein
VGARSDLLHHASLVDIRLPENSMKCCHYGHVEVSQQFQNMASGFPPKYSVFVLQTNYIDIASIEKIGCCPIGGEVAFSNLASHPRRVEKR